MVSDILGVFLAFIGQILLLSILVTTLVQITSSVFSLRQRNFQAVFKKVLKSLRTDENEDVTQNANKLEATENFYSASTSQNRFDKLVTPNGISWLSEKGLNRFLAANPIEFTESQKASITEKFEEIQLFMSKRFTLVMRYFSIVFAVIVAFTFQANTIDMLKKLSVDSSYRESIIKQVEAEAFNKLYTASKDNWESALNAAIKQYATDNQTMVSYVEQINKKVSTIAEAKNDFSRVLHGENIPNADAKAEAFAQTLTDASKIYLKGQLAQYDKIINAGATLGISIWPDPNYFAFENTDFYKRILGVLFTVILLSFGAPFWFKMLQNVVALRDILSPEKTKLNQSNKDLTR